jgi:hypothetical protein
MIQKRPTITPLSSEKHEFIPLDNSKNWTANAVIFSKEKLRYQMAGAIKKKHQRLNDEIIPSNDALVLDALLECHEDNCYYANSNLFKKYFNIEEYKSKVDASTVLDYPNIIEDISDLIDTCFRCQMSKFIRIV